MSDTTEWEAKYEEKELEYETLQLEFDEFKEDSQVLEAELERELEELRKELTVAEARIDKQNFEIEALERQKQDESKSSVEAQRKISRLMDELAKRDQNVNEIAVKHRKIEQINDNHERTQRVLEAKEKQLRSQLENEIENNVFVRDEFEDYKLQTTAKMQRLHEDLREAQADIEAYAASPRKSSDDPEFQAALQEREDLKKKLEEQKIAEQELVEQRMRAEEIAIEAKRKAQLAEEERLQTLREKDELRARLQAEQEELRKQLIEKNEFHRIKRTRRMSEDARRHRRTRTDKITPKHHNHKNPPFGMTNSVSNIPPPISMPWNIHSTYPGPAYLKNDKLEAIPPSPTLSDTSSSYMSHSPSSYERDDELSQILEENEVMQTRFEAQKERQDLQTTAKLRAQQEAEKATKEAERSERATRILLAEQTLLLNKAIEDNNKLKKQIEAQKQEIDQIEQLRQNESPRHPFLSRDPFEQKHDPNSKEESANPNPNSNPNPNHDESSDANGFVVVASDRLSTDADFGDDNGFDSSPHNSDTMQKARDGVQEPPSLLSLSATAASVKLDANSKERKRLSLTQRFRSSDKEDSRKKRLTASPAKTPRTPTHKTSQLSVYVHSYTLGHDHVHTDTSGTSSSSSTDSNTEVRSRNFSKLHAFCVVKIMDKHGHVLDSHRTDVSGFMASIHTPVITRVSEEAIVATSDIEPLEADADLPALEKVASHKGCGGVVWKQLFGHWKKAEKIDKLIVEVWNYHKYSWDDFLGTFVLLGPQMDGQTRNFKLLTKKFREPRKKDTISGYVSIKAKLG